MFKALILLAAAALFGATLDARADGLRLEATYGMCKYGKGSDGSWRKDGYPTYTSLTNNCYGIGISQTPFPTIAGKLGYRVSYIDFGLARADAVVPMRDDEANSYPDGNHCDTSTWSGCLGYYSQGGRAKGVSFGPILEQTFKYGTLGAEAGFYFYHSNWNVHAILPYSDCGGTCQQQAWEWDGASGYHLSPYLGLTYSFHGFFVQYRRYTNIYASQVSVTNNELAYGLIGGPLSSVQVGMQIQF